MSDLSKTQCLRILSDFPEVIPVSEEELALLETYLRDIINDVIKAE